MTARKKIAQEETATFPDYVVSGKDRRRAADTVAQLTDSILGDADPQVALNSYDGPNASLADVLDDLRTAPFLSPVRLVVVKDADDFISAHRQHLETYLNDPCPTGVLLMMANSFPGNTRLAKLAAKIGKVMSCDPLKPRDLPAYLTTYAADNLGLKLSRAAVAALIELGGDDAGMLLNELDKIAAYIGDTGTQAQITPEIVNTVVGHNRQYSVFNVIDAMTAQNRSLALTTLNQMLNQSRDAEFTAVGAFAWHFRRLYNARLLMDRRINGRDIIKQLRIWSQPDQFLQQVKRFDTHKLANMLRALMNIDLASKTGAGTVRSGLEKLIAAT